MELATIVLPLVGALLAFLVRSNERRPFVLPAFKMTHLVATVATLATERSRSALPWLALDPAGRLVLLLVSVIFAACSFYAVAYLRLRRDRPNRVFCGCLLLFVGMMSFIT